MLVLAIVTVAASLSLVFREVITIYIWLLSAILVISPIIVGSLFGRIQQNFGVASIVVNGILFIVLAFTGILTPENAYMIVVPGAVLYLFSIWRTKATQ
jgi:hypothetical protein